MRTEIYYLINEQQFSGDEFLDYLICSTSIKLNLKKPTYNELYKRCLLTLFKGNLVSISYGIVYYQFQILFIKVGS